MNFYECLKSSVYNVKSNKTRSLLTMLGIIIGIASVIAIVSIGNGEKDLIQSKLSDLGTNVISLQVNQDADGVKIENRDYFELADLDLIKERIPEATNVTASLNSGGAAKTDTKTVNSRINAVTADYFVINKLEMASGRFLNERDIESTRAVGTIDQTAADKLFHNQNPVGQKVKLNSGDNDLSITIIGVTKNSDDQLARGPGGTHGQVYIPITIADRLFTNTKISSISILLSDMTNSEEIAKDMIRLIERKHNNSNGNKYIVSKQFTQMSTVTSMLTTLTMVIGCIAGISLLVGGIGVMNIMLVSVTERTREIGIRKAIGAKSRDIKVQFITESIIICGIGGVIGMILGVILGNVIGKTINVTPVVSPMIIFIAFAFSTAIGIFFGYYPANQAAKLDPIESLRYE